MTGVTIGVGVATIGHFAFSDCFRLTSVAIPDNVGSIGVGAFYGCASVTNIGIGSAVSIIGRDAFRSCTSLTSIVIPDGVTTIVFNTFSDCNKLTSLTMGNGVTSIGDSAFSGCTSLTNVTMPDGLAAIGKLAFYACAGLTSVTIPESVTTIGLSAFAGCNGLTNIAVNAANLNYSSVDGVLFYKSLTLIQYPGGKAGDDYVIPENVAIIADYAFGECASLTSVTIPESVFAIGNFAFHACVGLKSMTIPNSVRQIGDGAFDLCNNLTSVYFADNAPAFVGSLVFSGDDSAIVYYLPGTTGWGATFAGQPIMLWNPKPQITGRADPFAFTITGTSNLVIVVEAATSLTSADWKPVGTNTLTDGSFTFSDVESESHPTRFYRLRSP